MSVYLKDGMPKIHQKLIKNFFFSFREALKVKVEQDYRVFHHKFKNFDFVKLRCLGGH